MSWQAVSRWPAVFRQVISAEQAVEEREMNGEVDVDGFLLDPMMPVVKTWGDEEPFKPGKAPAKVRVNESGIEINDEDVGVHRHGTEAEDKHWNDGGAAQRQDFKKMHPGAGHPVHAPRRVVHGMESPQPWNAMKCAMDPVLNEVSQKHDGRELDEEGKRPQIGRAHV